MDIVYSDTSVNGAQLGQICAAIRGLLGVAAWEAELRSLSALAGRLVASGAAERGAAERALSQAAWDGSLPMDAARGLIAAGLDGGIAEARAADAARERDFLLEEAARELAPLWERKAYEARRDALAAEYGLAGDAIDARVQAVRWMGVTPQKIEAAPHPVPRFDAAVLLPDALRPWIEDAAARMPCPIEYVAAPAIVALGAVIGARCGLKAKARDDWTVTPNLWGANVGLPSRKKSPAFEAAMAPLGRLVTKAKANYETAMKGHAAAAFVQAAHREAIETEIKAAAKGKGKAGKAADLAALERAYQEELARTLPPPKMRRYRTCDSTVEALGELERDNPAGILVVRDELTGLLASLEREGREGDRAFYLEGWNGGGSYDTDRIGRGSIFIESHCLSLFGGIQPDKLTLYLEQAATGLGNDGLMQRFQVVVFPDPVPWAYVDRYPDKAARDKAFAIFEALADFDPVAYGASPADDYNRRPFFRFSDAGQKVFVAWTTALNGRIARTEETENLLIIQHLGKYDKLFGALALIFHCVDVAAGTEPPGPVSEVAAARAAAWCESLEPHARRAYGLLMDDGLRAARELSRKVRGGALADGFTAREVRRHQWRHLTTGDAVDAALEWLEAAGWLKMAAAPAAPHGGRPTARFYINPAARGAADGRVG